MRSGTKYTLVALAAVGLLVAFDLLLFRGAPPERPELKLPDGRIIQLAKITEGQTHTWPATFRSHLRAFIPNALKRSMKPDFSSSFGFARPGLGLWLMCYDPASETYQQGWLNNATITDEHGCEFPAGGIGSTSDGYFSAMVLNFPTYPRRTNSFKVRLFDNTSKLIGEFPIRHQITRPPPSQNLLPEPLPIWKTNGPIVLRLNQFNTPTQPRFAVYRAGQPEPHWTIEESWFEDADGNSGDLICRETKAWKWRARFHRTDQAPFMATEFTTFRNILVPAPGQHHSIAASVTIAGVSMTNLAVIGTGKFEFSNAVLVATQPWRPGMSQGIGTITSRGTLNEYRSMDRPALILPRLQLPAGSKLILRLRQGEKVLGSASAGGSTMNFAFFDLDPQLAGTTVDLDLIVDEGRWFEAIVAPEAVIKTQPLDLNTNGP